MTKQNETGSTANAAESTIQIQEDGTTKTGVSLAWGAHERDGRTHHEWHAPCGCAFHPDPAPHWHPCDTHKPSAARHGERCHACGEYYDQVWRAPGALWARITGEKVGDGGLLCMSCFEIAAAANGIELLWECSDWRYPRADIPTDTTALLLAFDAAIRRVAEALGAGALGGVDTAHEINPETGKPWGPGGHTGYALEQAANRLKGDLGVERVRSRAAEFNADRLNRELGAARSRADRADVAEANANNLRRELTGHRDRADRAEQRLVAAHADYGAKILCAEAASPQWRARAERAERDLAELRAQAGRFVKWFDRRLDHVMTTWPEVGAGDGNTRVVR